MKKQYEKPNASVTVLSATSFLENTGEIIAVDDFNDDYGLDFI